MYSLLTPSLQRSVSAEQYVERYDVPIFLSLYLSLLALHPPPSLLYLPPIKRLKLNLWQSCCSNPGFQESSLKQRSLYPLPFFPSLFVCLSLSLFAWFWFLVFLSFPSNKTVSKSVFAKIMTFFCHDTPFPSCDRKLMNHRLIFQLSCHYVCLKQKKL